MDLPKPISHWQGIMAAFPEDIAALLLNLCNQLAPLIRNHPLQSRTGKVEPLGFDGLSRQVNYHRLLLSEWVLQDHFPEEFVRRAATGEHLFLEMQREENHEGRCCHALFDCGPEQLGRPRLAQLAVLILLARRAERHRLHFKWGVSKDAVSSFFDSTGWEVSSSFIDDHSHGRDVGQWH